MVMVVAVNPRGRIMSDLEAGVIGAALGRTTQVRTLVPANNPRWRGMMLWSLDPALTVEVGNGSFELTAIADEHLMPLRPDPDPVGEPRETERPRATEEERHG